MQVISFICLFFLLISNQLFAQVYKTQAISSEIHTISVNKQGDWLQLPVIDINSDEYIELSFDRMGDNSTNRLRYKVIHCNADWTQSSLSDIEYIDGFNDNSVDDYALSVNTTFEYTNFKLALPNNDMGFKLSGNYVVRVYEEDNTDNILLDACFSVMEPQIAISANITSNTLIDANREHQQVSFVINHQGMNIRDPFSDLKVFVRQNNRLDNQKRLVKPTYVQASKLLYEQNRDLIFEAGNEYRRFEIVSHRYNGYRIEHTQYDRPYYYASIIPDQIRSNKRYIYDEDQDGRFYIRNAEGHDSSIDADYFFVKFSLMTDNPILDNIYINGDFTDNTFDDDNLMKYDYERKEYQATLLLKQGAYNYQYLTKKGSNYSAAIIEGNYFQTENAYQIYIYHRPMGERYDRLIGFLNLEKKIM